LIRKGREGRGREGVEGERGEEGREMERREGKEEMRLRNATCSQGTYNENRRSQTSMKNELGEDATDLE